VQMLCHEVAQNGRICPVAQTSGRVGAG
jgi:hypothetical protein